MYQKELELLKKRGRYRELKGYPSNYTDLASNDYLGLGESIQIAEEAFSLLRFFQKKGAGASLLVNGYHPAHQLLERRLLQLTNFERALIVGNGFLGNMALFQLGRRGDLFLVDKNYHASGIVGSRLTQGKVRFFKHNDPESLLKEGADWKQFGRVFIVVEGVYSMEGDLVSRELLEVAYQLGMVIVDDAHGVGVVGKRLMGVTDLYDLPPDRTIKLGTMGKSLGSYGGYILGPAEVIDYLINRAPSVIYTTALSPFDTLYAYCSINWIVENLSHLHREIKRRQAIFHTPSLIKPIPVGNNQLAIEVKNGLEKQGVVVGAIRPPTVPSPIIRLNLRLPVPVSKIVNVLQLITDFL